jgi:hypothetical protein
MRKKISTFTNNASIINKLVTVFASSPCSIDKLVIPEYPDRTTTVNQLTIP